MMRSASPGAVFVRFFVFSLGLLLVIPACHKLYSYGSYRYKGTAGYGTISHPLSSRDMGGRPLIRYTDGEGTTHEFKSRAKTHWFYTPRKGERVKIYFHKDRPDEVIVANPFHYVVLPLVFLAVGSYCCLYAIGLQPARKQKG